jgi:hypothetical protein
VLGDANDFVRYKEMTTLKKSSVLVTIAISSHKLVYICHRTSLVRHCLLGFLDMFLVNGSKAIQYRYAYAEDIDQLMD